MEENRKGEKREEWKGGREGGKKRRGGREGGKKRGGGREGGRRLVSRRNYRSCRQVHDTGQVHDSGFASHRQGGDVEDVACRPHIPLATCAASPPAATAAAAFLLAPRPVPPYDK